MLLQVMGLWPYACMHAAAAHAVGMLGVVGSWAYACMLGVVESWGYACMLGVVGSWAYACMHAAAGHEVRALCVHAAAGSGVLGDGIGLPQVKLAVPGRRAILGKGGPVPHTPSVPPVGGGSAR